MAGWSERPWEMRNRDRDNFEFNRERQPAAPAAGATRPGRGATGRGADVGTVALAISAMTFYWMMPLLMHRQRRRRGSADQQPGESR